MNRPETAFENLPQMVEFLINKVMELEAQLQVLAPPKADRTTMDIDEVVEYTKKTKSTIYKLVRIGKIPSYKRGKKLYFVKEEIEEWLFNMPKHYVSADILNSSDSPQRKTAVDRMKPAARRE